MTLASYKPTLKQTEALRVIGGNATHCMLFGGSRSGKTFIACRATATRAIAAPKSRHAVLRFRFNHVKASVVLDTFPKMMDLCFPSVDYDIDKTDWYARLQNDSQVWFGGLDDKERTEKILGQEYATLYLNECSQIPYASRNMALTRLAQKVTHSVGGVEKALRLKALYDCNPPSQAHWSYKLFMQGRDPDTNKPIDRSDYAALQMNPGDNVENLPAEYLKHLASLPARMRIRFLDGLFADLSEGALFPLEIVERWRATSDLPDMQRIVVAVDPSGSGDDDNIANDDIGIVVCGLGTDGNGYVLEDLTLKAGPATWGAVAVSAYDRWDADWIVGETNFGGEMVKFVVETAAAKPERKHLRRPPFEKLTASRGKVVRAEPISALAEEGKCRLAGYFPELEDELCAFTTHGYTGTNSPNRADAMIWGMSKLFPGMTKEKREAKPPKPRSYGAQGYLAA